MMMMVHVVVSLELEREIPLQGSRKSKKLELMCCDAEQGEQPRFPLSHDHCSSAGCDP
jgi:hypothetical protein